VDRVRQAIREGKTRVIDLDLRSYFDNVRHHTLLAKLARRIEDADVLHLLKLILAVTGAKGVPQGAVISPLLSNVYLNEVDRMLERAREQTREGKRTRMQTRVSPTTSWSWWTANRGMSGCFDRWTDGCARSWPSSRSRSTKRRAEPWTW
jgi:retron-type reverse transcriptase